MLKSLFSALWGSKQEDEKFKPTKLGNAKYRNVSRSEHTLLRRQDDFERMQDRIAYLGNQIKTMSLNDRARKDSATESNADQSYVTVKHELPAAEEVPRARRHSRQASVDRTPPPQVIYPSVETAVSTPTTRCRQISTSSLAPGHSTTSSSPSAVHLMTSSQRAAYSPPAPPALVAYGIPQDPRQLRLSGYVTCIGYAHTKGRRCRIPPLDKVAAEQIYDSIRMAPAGQMPDLPLLVELTELLCCADYHSDQAQTIAEQWHANMSNYTGGSTPRQPAGNASVSSTSSRSGLASPFSTPSVTSTAATTPSLGARSISHLDLRARR